MEYNTIRAQLAKKQHILKYISSNTYDKSFANTTYKLGDFNRSKHQGLFIKQDKLRELYELVAADAFPIRAHDGWESSKKWDFQIIPLTYLDTKLHLLDGLEMLEKPYDYIELYQCYFDMIDLDSYEQSPLNCQSKTKYTKNIQDAYVELGLLMAPGRYSILTFPEDKESITCKKDGKVYTNNTFTELIKSQCTSEENLKAFCMKFMDKLPEKGYKLIKWHVNLLQVHRGMYPPHEDNSSYYEYLH